MGAWTADDIPDQSGRFAVVTGANSGLGLIIAQELARAGARVVLACRNTEKGDAAAARIRATVPGSEVEVGRLDLADLSSVREFAERTAAETPELDLLVNNAGVMAAPRRQTADGFELHIGTNHLGHFALTGLLLDPLVGAAEARVVTMSSEGHRGGRISFDNLQGKRRYQRWLAYCQSKLANLLFAYELQRRAEAAGLRLRSMAAHPGYSATNLQSAGVGMGGSTSGRLQGAVMAVTNRLIAQSEEAGALGALRAATDPAIPGGSYVGPAGMGGTRGYPEVVGSSGRSKDPETARRLWEVSEELTGVRYDFEAGQGQSAASGGDHSAVPDNG
jgi:NAD(P)-dependent dehydrogenase (short-subunit alcohol dehydrogenase family)